MTLGAEKALHYLAKFKEKTVIRFLLFLYFLLTHLERDNKREKERLPIMITSLRPTVGYNGQITIEKNYQAGGDKPTTNDTKENKADLAENRATVTDATKELTATALDTTQESNVGRLDLTNGLQGIQQLALPMINSALGLPATSVGGSKDKGEGDPGLTQQLFGQLFAGGEKGNDLMKNFAGLAATVTGKSLGDVGKVMDTAKGLFSGGNLKLADAAGFIGKALGLNEKAIGLIATAYMLLSNPFTAKGAFALFKQAMSLISESKTNKKQANTAQNTAKQQQQLGLAQWKIAQERIQKTAVMQTQIKEAMEKLKNNQVLTKEQIEKLIKMNQQMKNQPKVDQNPKLMQQQALQPKNPALGKYATTPILNANTPTPNTNGLTPQGVGNNIQQPIIMANINIPTVAQPPAVSFSPPPFSGKF